MRVATGINVVGLSPFSLSHFTGPGRRTGLGRLTFYGKVCSVFVLGEFKFRPRLGMMNLRADAPNAASRGVTLIYSVFTAEIELLSNMDRE